MTKSEKKVLLPATSIRTRAILVATLVSMTLLGACDSVGWYGSARDEPRAIATSDSPRAAAESGNPLAARTLARGRFYDGPHAPGHRVSGNASISRAADGAYWLSFTQFVSDEGPDVNIILSPAQTPKSDAAVKGAGYITVAARKALTGDQSYRLPKDFDPSLYQSVGIWCEEFGVLFGAAQLQVL